jgi:hypothetical protein
MNIDYLSRAGLLETTEADLLRYAESAEEVWQSIGSEIAQAG